MFEKNGDPLGTPSQSFPNALSTALLWADPPGGAAAIQHPGLGDPHRAQSGLLPQPLSHSCR